MKLEVLGCYGGESPSCRVTSLLVNNSIALDAGSLAQALPLSRQRQVRAILLTHSHTDHTASLPFFVENVYADGSGVVDIYASDQTIFSLRRHLFNNSAWPDFSHLPHHLLPTVRFHRLEPEVPVFLDGVRFTPFAVDHLVETFGFLVEQGGSAVLWSSDTGPTVRLWELANATPHLQTVWIDTSFDSGNQEIADISMHLTPTTLVRELEKLEVEVPLLLHHLKPLCVESVQAEVQALGRPDLHFLQQGRIYEF